MTERVYIPPEWGTADLTVVIPARNEATRLRQALTALAKQGGMDIVLVANGCDDATAAIARAGVPELSIAVIEMPASPAGVGAARRRGMDLALQNQARALATTDADCEVEPGWRDGILAALCHADAACGRVIPKAAEYAILPALVRAHGELEEYVADLAALEQTLCHPVAWNPWPCHGQTPGASLAFTPAAYRIAGGFDPIPCHEDRRLIARIEAAGLRVARPRDVSVVASCRTVGRAPGGMADTIAKRRDDAPRLLREMIELRARASALHDEIAILSKQTREARDHVLPFQQAAV